MSKVFYNAQNLTIGNGFIKNPDRYYLEEYFEQLPKHGNFIFNYNYITCPPSITTQFGNSADGVLADGDKFSMMFFGSENGFL